MKVLKYLLMLATATGLMAGCATNKDRNGMGSEREVGTQTGGGYSTPDTAPQQPMEQNGSIGKGNPFGLGPGNTLR